MQNIIKANNHSKVIWFNQTQTELIEFHIWDLKDSYNRKYNCVSLRNTLRDTYVINQLKISIQNIWEAKDDIYTLVCNTNHTKDRLNEDFINNIFIVDARHGTIN